MDNNQAFLPSNILLPKKGTDLPLWSVLACDQYTAQPSYWEAVAAMTAGKPSTYHLTLPELYLEGPDTEARIEEITRTMVQYSEEDVFELHANTLFYVERTQSDGSLRRGLIGKLDLEQYDYRPGASSAVRATEGTIVERIGPRAAVRKDATLELPHVLVLVDDAKKTVIEPLADEISLMTPLYDFELMQGGGHVRGFELSAEQCEAVLARMAALDENLVLLAGDGNHSLAAAKTHYEALKPTLCEETRKHHPARYALVELENLWDEGLILEPIHRVLFEADAADFERVLVEKWGAAFEEKEGFDRVELIVGNQERPLFLPKHASIAHGTVQRLLDEYLAEKPGRLDYVHGEAAVRELCAQQSAIGILFGVFDREQFNTAVQRDGVMPRKTFSLGHADDKRFYLEARRIR